MPDSTTVATAHRPASMLTVDYPTRHTKADVEALLAELDTGIVFNVGGEFNCGSAAFTPTTDAAVEAWPDVHGWLLDADLLDEHSSLIQYCDHRWQTKKGKKFCTMRAREGRRYCPSCDGRYIAAERAEQRLRYQEEREQAAEEARAETLEPIYLTHHPCDPNAPDGLRDDDAIRRIAELEALKGMQDENGIFRSNWKLDREIQRIRDEAERKTGKCMPF